MKRVGEGDERKRAAALQGKCGCRFWIFAQSGVGEKFKVAPLGNPFLRKMVALLWARNNASSIFQGGKRYETKKRST
jgi:hypothetical protein